MEDNSGSVQKISELLSYIQSGNPDAMALCQFLCLRTFEDFQTKALHFQRVEADGTIKHFAHFGWAESELATWATITVNDHVPAADAIKHNSMVWLADRSDWVRDYPNIALRFISPDAQTYITYPINIRGYYMALIGIVLNRSLLMTPELKSFFEIIGGLVGLHLSTKETARGGIARTVTPWDLLTRRHREVLAMIADGLTNIQIASELGYSESTIRQDTIKIYEILGVSGRREAAQAYRTRPREQAS